MFINQILTKLKSLVYSKSETDSLLNGKASSSHTHTKSQITDFPTIPSKTSQLTNDSGFITGVSWDSVSNKPSTFIPSSHTHTKSQITDFPSLATVATSGSYSDLSNRSLLTVNGATSLGWSGIGGVANGSTLQLCTTDNTSPSICFHRAGYSHVVLAEAGGVLGIQAQGSDWLELATKSWVTSLGYITSSGSCNYANSAGYASSAGSAGEVSTSVAADSTKNLVYASMADNDQCRIMCGGASNAGYMEIATSDDGNEPIYVRQYNNGTFGSIVRTLTLLDGSGNTQFPGTVSASTFSGNLNGNCTGTAGGVAWTNVSGRPTALSQFTNDNGYITADGAAYPRRVGGVTMNFNWSGQGGQPTWLWGGEDGTNMYVYNPANFSVNYAANSGYTNWLRTSSHTDHLLHTEWDGSYFWTYVTAGDGGYRAVRVERSNSAGWADSAGGVAWGNVSGRPWALSQFTNDSGFITSSSLMYINGDRANNAYRIECGTFNNSNNVSTGRHRVTFPHSFSSTPKVMLILENPDGNYFYQISNVTTTSFIFEIWDGGGNRTANGVAASYIAIGNI